MMEDLRFATSLHIMIYLANTAHHSEELMTSVQLADGVNANPALVRKLLSPLAAAGLIETFQGKSGGARLARPAKHISLKEIYIAASDKELAFCRENINEKCPISTSMKKVFGLVADGMQGALHKHLDSITLQSLIK